MRSNKKLVEELLNMGYLKTEGIIRAFLAIDRADFVPEDVKQYAYADTPLPIGYGQTISQPLTVALMLELLKPKPGERVLDVGAGSGWQTALLAHIVSPKDGNKPPEPLVVGIECIRELAAFARGNIGKYGYEANGVAVVVEGNAREDIAVYGLFDKIIAAASAEAIPGMWKEQLKVGGRIVAPVGESIVALEKTGADKFEQKQYFGFRFVPLVTR